MRLVMHVETDIGEALSDAYVVKVDDDLLSRLHPDHAQDHFLYEVKQAATQAYREAVGK
jgi:hypothetical protein